MAGDGPSSASPTAPTHQRTSSSQSAGKAAGGRRGKTGKPHAVGKHNRNASGKNLNKLAMALVSDAGEQLPTRPQRAKSAYTPSGSPSSTHVRRNKSEVALPRSGSKVQIKKNQSAVALKRNESASRLKRLSRPTTPKEPKEDQDSQLKGHAQPAFGFGSDDDEEDEDEWTEESASQSPTVTRTGSMKGPRPVLPIVNQTQRKPSTDTTQTVHGDSPTTPLAAPPPDLLTVHPSHEPDPQAITNRLLKRTSSSQLAPKLSTISAGGSSGAQTPANTESNGASMLASQISFPTSSQSNTIERQSNSASKDTPSDPSLGKDGISRFLGPHAAASSSGRSGTNLHNAMGMIRPQGSDSRPQSPNPTSSSAPTGEGVRRAKSVGHLARNQPGFSMLLGAPKNGERRDSTRSYQTHSRQGSLEDDPREIDIDPFVHRRPGGNMSAKMSIWKAQAAAADAEPPSVGPPAPLIQRLHGGAIAAPYLGVEERRVRMAEEAEKQLDFLRLFRNPSGESCERVRRDRRSREKENERSGRQSNGHHGRDSRSRENYIQSQAKKVTSSRPSTATDVANGISKDGSSSVGSGGTTINGDSFEPHTPSRRSVRFDVGAEENGEYDGDESGEELRLSNLLRSLWEGPPPEVET